MHNQNEVMTLALEFMKATRANNTSKLMIDNFRQMLPDIPDDFWDAVKPEALNDKIASVYAKHLTIEDMQGALEFFNSPVGQNILDKNPAIMQESMKIGQEWGEELACQWEEKHDVE